MDIVLVDIYRNSVKAGIYEGIVWYRFNFGSTTRHSSIGRKRGREEKGEETYKNTVCM